MRNSQNRSAVPPSWAECIFIGLVAALCAVIGHNMYICNGILEGFFFTIILPYLFIFVPALLPGFLILAALVATGVRELPAHSYFSGRLAHLTACISAASLLIANVLSYAFQSRVGCSVGVWN